MTTPTFLPESARTYAPKLSKSSYKGPIVGFHDGQAYQQISKGAYIQHPATGLDAQEGDSLTIAYMDGQRTIAPYEPGVNRPGNELDAAQEAKTPKAPKEPTKTVKRTAKGAPATKKPSMADVESSIYQRVAKSLLQAMEEGNTMWQKPWGASRNQSRPHNGTTGTNYAGMNVVLLHIEMLRRGSSDTRFMTYRQCEAMAEKMRADGVPEDQLPQVKKGSKSVEIIKFGKTQPKVTPILDESGNPVLDEDGKPKVKKGYSRSFLQTFNVFHASDIANMPPMPEVDPLPQWQVHALAEDYVKALNVDVQHVPGNRACYSSLIDRITMPERTQFKTQDAYYSTLIHESAHATGHESRLNRPLGNMFGSEPYAYEELIAETASAMVCARLGIAPDMDANSEFMQQHAAYLTSWKGALKSNPEESVKTLMKAMGEAEKCARYLMQEDMGLEAKHEPEGHVMSQGLNVDLNHDLEHSSMNAFNPQPDLFTAGEPANEGIDQEYEGMSY